MNIKYIVIHHSSISNSNKEPQFNRINQAHKYRNWVNKENPLYLKPDKNGNYIQYDYFIEEDGTLRFGNPIDVVGWHCGDWAVNTESVGICLAGNYEYDKPSVKQLQTLSRLLGDIILDHDIEEENILSHSDVKPTLCPGKNLTCLLKGIIYPLYNKINMTYDISRWNSLPENQLDEYSTIKLCQTYGFLNCLEHEYNKRMCYKHKVLRPQTIQYCKVNGLNLDEVEVQNFAKEKAGWQIPFLPQPIQIGGLVDVFREHPIPGTNLIIGNYMKIDVSDKVSLRFQIEQCLKNRVPLYVGVKGRYTHKEINGVWTKVYTQYRFSISSHAMMVDGIDNDGNLLCENSTVCPRGIIEDINCIQRCYAFSFKEQNV